MSRPSLATRRGDHPLWMTAAFAAAAMLVSYLPFSAVNGVLGTVGRSTGAGTGDLQWVTDAFTVALVGAVLSGGVLGDLYGRRRITLVGLGLTGLGTASGYLAGGLAGPAAIHLLWFGQAVSGLGAGLVMSATLALIAATAPSPAARAQLIAVWAAANVVGLGSGPFLAAGFVGPTGWRWLFVPIGLLALAVLAFGAAGARESSAPAGRRLDRPGQVTAVVGIVALVYGVIRGGTSGWAAPGTVLGLAVGVAGLAAFVLVESTVDAPLMRPKLFARRGFTAAGLAAMVMLFAVVGIVFVLSLFFAQQHLSTLDIAVRLGCLFGGNVAASLAAARLQSWTSPRIVLSAGMLVAAAGVASLLSLSAITGLAGIAGRLAVVGAGGGVVVATSTVIAVQSVGPELAGMAGAANNVVRQLGGALGPAVIGAVLAARLHAGADFATAVRACAVVLLILVLVAAAITAVLLFTPTSVEPQGNPSQGEAS